MAPVIYPNDTHISAHFTWAEFGVANRRTVPFKYQQSAVKLCAVLERARAHFGKPVHITEEGGYRAHEVQVAIWANGLKKYGSAAKASLHIAKPGSSQHEYFTAGDTWIEGVSVDALAAYYAKQPEVGGIGVYHHDGFVHVDVRPRYRGLIARW